MTTIDEVPATYDDAVRMLAHWHAGMERPDLEIYSIPDPAGAEVRLVEVSDEFPSSGRVMPVSFGCSQEFPYRSSVVLLTRGEWQQLLAKELALPGDWTLDQRQRVWPDGAA